MVTGTVHGERRRPAVAGTFYAGTERLREQVKLLLPEKVPQERVVGAVAPHAGFLYSGRVAGAVYARIEPPATLVILGPNHTGMGAEAAIMTEGVWATPLGEVRIDRALARAILDGSRALEEDALAHRDEHSIEALDPEGLFGVVARERISMCGFHPTTAAMVAAKALGAARGRLVQYATSGDVAGDYRQVVGYAGLLMA